MVFMSQCRGTNDNHHYMFVVVVVVTGLSLVVAVSSQAQGRHNNDDDQREDPDARSGMTAPTESSPECVQDAFTFLASERCHVDCLQMTAAFCLQCDRTCNSSSGGEN